MSEPVAVPLWLFLAIAAFALWSLVDRLLVPSVRWLLRRRLNRLIDTVNRRLAVEIRPFQLTKRQVLIDLTSQGQALKDRARVMPSSILAASQCSVAELTAVKNEITALRDRLNAGVGV